MISSVRADVLSPGTAVDAGFPASGLASPKYGFEAPASG